MPAHCAVFQNKEWFGLYRDDGLGVYKGSGPEAARMEKQISKILKKHGLKIETNINVKRVDFLDIKFDLETHTYRPYHKPNHTPKYVHVDSDHPPTVKRSVPKTIETRLSMLSSTKQIFDEEKGFF